MGMMDKMMDKFFAILAPFYACFWRACPPSLWRSGGLAC